MVRIRSDGTVSQDPNIDLRLDADYDLRRFPFDRQTLEVQVESFSWDRDQDSDPERSHRIDKRARWLFPLAYGAMLALAWFTTPA